MNEPFLSSDLTDEMTDYEIREIIGMDATDEEVQQYRKDLQAERQLGEV